MPHAVLDHLWTHESSRLPGASYTAPGSYFQGGDPKKMEFKMFEPTKKNNDYFNLRFGTPDLSSWQYIQFFMRNPNLRSKMQKYTLQMTKIKKKTTPET